MKSVLISINPKWCKLIASGKKTVEVRKTRPTCKTPFKCYIYCTKGKPTFTQSAFCEEVSNGKIIGEFVCDRITKYECSSDGFGELATTCGTCLTYDEILNYCNGNDLYGWHISDLVIYDEPRELSEFLKATKVFSTLIHDIAEEGNGSRYNKFYYPLKRPPQSWCYVESEDTE